MLAIEITFDFIDTSINKLLRIPIIVKFSITTGFLIR